MRHIAKGEPPTLYAEWMALESEDWHPSYDDLRGDEKRAVLAALRAEQAGLCAYCGMRIDAGTRSHIDHVQSQAGHEALRLRYDNMVLSCGPPTDDMHPQHGWPTECHCGDAKRDQLLAITPLQPDCGSYFAYAINGAVAAAPAAPNADHATAAVNVLLLNCDELQVRRRAAIRAFALEHRLDLDAGLGACVTPDAEGLLPSFGYVIWAAVTGA